MYFEQNISGPIFIADAPDVVIGSANSGNVRATITVNGDSWDIELSPSLQDGEYKARLRMKDVLDSIVGSPDFLDATASTIAPKVSIKADNGMEEAVSMEFQALYGNAEGKTPADMKRHWLTWREQISATTRSAREFLTFVSGLKLLGWKAGTFSAMARLFIHGSEPIDIPISEGQLESDCKYYKICYSPSKLCEAASVDISKLMAIDCWFSLSGTDSGGSSASVTSFPLRMIVSGANDLRMKEFIFRNSLGIEDRVISFGVNTRNVDGESRVFTSDGLSHELDNSSIESFQVQSGNISSARGAALWSDFLKASGRYMVSGEKATEIVVEEWDTDITEGALGSVSFKYHLSRTDFGRWFEDSESLGNYDPLEKFGALSVAGPEVATPPAEDLFFLKTRLDEFPLVELGEDFLLLVQSSASYSWGSASLKSLSDWLAKNVSAEALHLWCGPWEDYSEAVSKYALSAGAGKELLDIIEKMDGQAVSLLASMFTPVYDDAKELVKIQPKAPLEIDEVSSKGFSSGVAGSGFQLLKKKDGSTLLTVDDAIIRRSLSVSELIIQQLKHQGGIVFYTAASMEVSAVERVVGGWKCFFDTKNGQVPNEFEVNDQARCQRFELGTTTAKYYWRLVTEVGADYIVLSEADCDAGSNVPEAGDIIVQLGNRTNARRQAAKVTVTIGENSPRDEYYKGISAYDLTGKLVTVVGVNDGEMGIYTEAGKFSGQVVIGAGSAGLENLDEWADASSRIDDAASIARDAQAKVNNLLDIINSDDILDLSEKRALRVEWTAINGIESTSRSSENGTYAQTKRNFDASAFPVESSVFVYNGQTFTYGQYRLVCDIVGISALDAAYLALREFLHAASLNDRENITEDFDRTRLAELLTTYYECEQRVRDVAASNIDRKVDATKQELLSQIEDYQTAVNAAVSDLQDQIDNAITSWYNDGEPGLDRYPCVGDPEGDWSTDEIRKKHIGDLYYDRSTGIGYRFLKDESGVYSWELLRDEAISEALGAAADAKDLADQKRRTFFAMPTAEDAYDEGDLWVNATYGSYTNEMLVCKTAKAAGIAFNISHWQRASKYTDDTVANAAKQAAENAQKAADQAAVEASNANVAAAAAQSDATKANEKLTSWASDSNISPTEKEALKQQQNAVQKEFEELSFQGDKYKGYITSYDAELATLTNAYNAAIAAFAKYTSTESEVIAIGGDYGNIAAYYNTKATFANLVAAAAKKRADDASAEALAAQGTADSAMTAAGNAQSSADSAKDAADAAQADATKALADAKAADDKAAAAATAASEANSRLSNWASNGYISPTEKTALRQQLEDVKKQHEELTFQGEKYKGYITGYDDKLAAFQSAYDAAIAAFTKYTATSPENITVGSDYANISAYYTARATFSKLIAIAANELAETAKANADESLAILSDINSDSVLDINEKEKLRQEWVAINGIESTSGTSDKGSYYAARSHALKITQNRKLVTGAEKLSVYAGSALVFNHSGLTALDDSYIALRECLSGLSINDRYNVTRNFNRDELAERLRDYYDAESAIYALTDDEERSIIADSSTENKEEFARRLGYESWKDMVSAAEAGKTIISGGMIRTELLDAAAIATKNAFIENLLSQDAFINNLLVKRLRTNPPGSGTPRVETEGNEITIFDKEDNPVLSMNGDYYESLAAFTDTSGGQTSVELMPKAATASGGGSIPNADPAWEFLIENTFAAENTFEITNPGRSLVTCEFIANANTTFSASRLASISLQYYNFVINAKNTETGAVYNMGQTYMNVEGSSLIMARAVLPKGKYKINVYFSATVVVEADEAVDVDITMSVMQQQTASVDMVSERAEIFANGFGYRYNSQQYFAVMRPGTDKSSSESLVAVVRVGNYMLRISSTGLQKSTNGGSSWTSL